MKQKLLALGVICMSFASGIFGSFLFQYIPIGEISSQQYSSTSDINSGEKSSETKEITNTIDVVSLESEITKTVETVSQSIVSIVISKDLVIYRSDPWGFFQQPSGTISRQVGGGSGFFIKKDGTILTNKHVVSDNSAQYTVILSDGSEYPAKVIATDPVNDLAVIKINPIENNTGINREFIPLEIAPEDTELQIGEFAIAVGNALAEFQNSVSLGIVSGKNRTIEAMGESLTGLIQTDAAINPGNSGGPLMSLDGHVIGINTAIASNSNGIGFAFALSQERIDYILKSIDESGRIKRPFIGINFIPNSPGVAAQLGLSVDYGVYIIDEAGSVVTGSSAQTAGLEPGDIILESNGKKITGNTLTEIIQNSLPGDTLTLKVLKKSGEQTTLELQLGET